MKTGLIIDTSLYGIALAVYDMNAEQYEQSVVATFVCPQPRAAEVHLAPQVTSMLRDVTPLQRVVVSIGPGTFTGIRIGMSFAKGLALDRDIVGISSLRAIAEYLALERGELRLYKAITSRYGVVAECEEQATLAAWTLEEKNYAPSFKHIVAGSWDALEETWDSVSYESIGIEELMRYSLRALHRQATRQRTESLTPLYMRPPYSQ